MSVPWTLVKESDLFAFTGISSAHAVEKMTRFLRENHHLDDMRFVFNSNETWSALEWHLYYHSPVVEADPADKDRVHTAGVVEFRRVHTGTSQGWSTNGFEWRIVREEDGPSSLYRGLPLRVIDSLTTPAPNRKAEAWRWYNWMARNCQPPVHVGMGVTYGIGSDAYPYVVVECHPKRKSIVIAPVEYHVVSGSEQTGDAVYAFGEKVGNQSWVITPSRRKVDSGKNLWRFQGGVGWYQVGIMSAKRDPSY